jgi:hypothetical protein
MMMRGTLAILVAIGVSSGCSNEGKIPSPPRESKSERAGDELEPERGGGMEKKGVITSDAIVVSEKSFRSKETGDIVESNVSFINALFDECLTEAEVSAEALRSYYVDYYLAQVNNGGFSQFVYNSRWNPQCIEYVREGMRAMKAKQHLEVFEEGAELVKKLGSKGLKAYLASEYFGENTERDKLNGVNDRFMDVEKKEDLLTLNAAWLRRHPKLLVLEVEEMKEEVRRRGQALPDREQRVAEARANEPRYMKLIRALCERAGQKLERVTAGDPTRVHEGVRTLAWHFITDKGHHHMVDVGGKAIMFRGHSTTDRVCEIEAPDE